MPTEPHRGLNGIVHWFLTSTDADPVVRARTRTLIIGSFLGAGVALGFFVERLLAEPGFGPHHITVLAAAFVAGITPLVLKWTGRYDLAMYLLLSAVTGAVAIDAYFYGGLGAASFVAIMILPLMGTLYGGTRVGAATTAAQMIVVSAFFALHLAEVKLPDPPDPDRQRMMLAAATIGVLSFIYLLALTFERERIAAQSHKLMSDRRYAVAYATSSDGLFEWVPTTQERFLSPPLRGFLGPDAATEGPPLLPHTHPEDAEAFASSIDAAMIAPTPPIRFRLAHHSGEYRTVECRLIGMRDLDGHTRVLGTVLDIDEAHRLQQLKDQFLAVVSHELRTPLTSIRGSLSLMSSQALGQIPGPAQEMLDIAERNGERLTLLVDDLLDLQQLDSGNMVTNLHPTALNEVIANAVEAVSGQAEKRHIEIDASPTDAWVLGDSRRLSQVLINFLSNAVKFSPERSQIEIRSNTTAFAAHVRVVDHGAGIPEAFRDRVFDRFTQAQNPGTRAVGGTGLGLAISQSIIEQHHGKIGYETELGEGTTFWIEVPLASADD